MQNVVHISCVNTALMKAATNIATASKHASQQRSGKVNWLMPGLTQQSIEALPTSPLRYFKKLSDTLVGWTSSSARSALWPQGSRG